jgi:hypothetical protein
MRCGGKGDAIPLIQFLKMPRPVGGELHSIDGYNYYLVIINEYKFKIFLDILVLCEVEYSPIKYYVGFITCLFIPSS